MAQLDFRAAEADWKADPPLLEDIAFHCQQAAEKSFKAFLAWNDVAFGKTHDLGKLGTLAAGLDSSLAPVARGAAPLTAYAVLTRYPSEEIPITSQAAKEAGDLARKVFSSILERLPQDVRP
ncbi:MAG: HEPN domain-containing protein [Planctomycetota bacterium]